MISRTRNVGGVLPIKIVPIGNWLKAGLLVSDMRNLIAIGSMTGQRSAALKLKALVRKNLKGQGVPGMAPWPDLAPGYKKAKAKAGFSPDLKLIRTGLYYRSITTWTKGTKYYVGIKKGVRASGKNSAGKTLGYIAHILERGSHSHSIKARPLWVPTFKQFGGNKRIKNIIVWHIARLIYLRHGVKVKVY